jgi:hypothetical protein
MEFDESNSGKKKKARKEKERKKFLVAPMGVLVPGLCTRDPQLGPPIDINGNLQAHMSAESPSNTSEVISEIYDRAGGRGGPRIFLLVGILLFLIVWSPCKISESYNRF